MPRTELPDWLILLGTIAPILAVVATVLLAASTRGVARALVLFVVPALGLAVTWFALPATGKDGNLLAVVLFMAYCVALTGYYPLLAILALVRRRRAEAA